jgi:hypothetical protein
LKKKKHEGGGEKFGMRNSELSQGAALCA